MLGWIDELSCGHGANLPQGLVAWDGVVWPLVTPGDICSELARVDAGRELFVHALHEFWRDAGEVLVDDARQQPMGVYHKPLDRACGLLLCGNEGACRLVIDVQAVALQGRHGLFDEGAHDEAAAVALGQRGVEARPRAGAQLKIAQCFHEPMGGCEP